ncbi:uncharacterized protein LOC108094749 isoform X3 [Drosophila ficusphila]|uniref:uncharacterized protein LOC108094749 isoform X3 n=1 Tax=Drosophila ficusphila TaxID=30025 RepID=UPI0007E73B58|nr:uncharacterized protein LOC108094749 isoform X3 [Drosophila ficusphila]
MNSALIIAGVSIILGLMGLASSSPTTTPITSSPIAKINLSTEDDPVEIPIESPVVAESIAPTAERNKELLKQRPSLAQETSENEQVKIKCQNAWEKFVIEFGAKYKDNAETEKRRNIFCENWKKIQDHNRQHELGLYSFKKGINQFSDLTFEEWKDKQPTFRPDLFDDESTTQATKMEQSNLKCQDAWEKFLVDFGRKYKDDAETIKRRNIFCENWQEVQDHNKQHELGLYSFKKGINQFSDLTFEEWKDKQPTFPPDLFDDESTTQATKLDQQKIKCQNAWEKFLVDFGRKYKDNAETEKRRNIFCENWQKIQDHNRQHELGLHSFKKGINQFSDLTFEEWKDKQPTFPPDLFDDESTTKATKGEQPRMKCQEAWEKFLVDFGRKYKDSAETEKRRNIFCENWQKIQDHNRQHELGLDSFKKGINQFSDLTFEEWKNKQRHY